jgi:hypothetical protein
MKGFEASAAGALLLSVVNATANAADRVWLIGGGYDLDNSQVQIEQNVLWARTVLRTLPGERSIHVHFNDGDDPAPDVTLWQPPEESAATLQPLARIYDSYYLNGESVRNHGIDPVDGPATRAAVRAALREGIVTLTPGTQGLMVYAGHGSPGDSGSVLNLWGDGRFDPDDLRDIVARQPAGTRLRFVFTQCYAGGFHAAVLPATGDPERCGFYAVAADQPSEGCTSGLDIADYRGYGTYFFAALAGQARDGGALLADPDRNGDGRVDPYEAHLYTLRVARSTDVPRSSSEQYLLDWEPWYLPLLPVAPQPGNPYPQTAAALGADLGIAAPTRRAVHDHRKQVRMQIRRLIYRQEQARARAQGAIDQLQHAVETRWPGARYTRTLAYKRFLEQDLDAAQAFIETHTLYPDLVAAQDEYWNLDKAVLELQRRLAQLDRIEHIQRIGRLRDALLARGGKADRAMYERLLACERHPL